MFDLQVKIPGTDASSYRIGIATDTLASSWQKMDGDFPKPAKFVVTDQNLVAAGHYKTLLAERDIPTFI
ncbi:MAG: hypothetical protein ACYS29_14605, partial [Planctomycetota bacterium]